MYRAKGIENNYIYIAFEGSQGAKSFVFFLDGGFIEKMELSRGEKTFVEVNSRLDGFYDGVYRIPLKNGMHRAFFRTYDKEGRASDTIAFPIFINDSFGCALCTAEEPDRGAVSPDEFFGYKTGFVKYNEKPTWFVVSEPKEEPKAEPKPVYTPIEKPKAEPKVEPKPVSAPAEKPKEEPKVEPKPVPAPIEKPKEEPKVESKPAPAPIEKPKEEPKAEPLPLRETEHKKPKKINALPIILLLALLGLGVLLFFKTEKFTDFSGLISIKDNIITTVSNGREAVSEWFESTFTKEKTEKETEQKAEEPSTSSEPETPLVIEQKPENTYGHEMTMTEVLSFLEGEWTSQNGSTFTVLKFSGFSVERTVYICKAVSTEEVTQNALCYGGNYYSVEEKALRSGDYSISEADEKSTYGISIILPPDNKNTDLECLAGEISVDTEGNCFTFVQDNGMRKKYCRGGVE